MTAPLALVFFWLLLLLGAGVWIGLALMAAGMISLSLFRDLPVAKLAAFDVWNSLNAPELVALPMFILMGEILFHTKLARNLFDGLSPWLGRIPGRLLHVNVLGCTLFAAVSGSSAATTATIGRMTLGELKARGYDMNLAMGSLCGAGTLGFLIPPSIILILYGVLSETSILALFLAGIVPGIALALAYMTYLGVRVWLNPALQPSDDGEATDWPARLAGLKLFAPVLFLIGAVLGSMYLGFAGPSEAAVIGVLGALLVGAAQKALSRENMRLALRSTVRTVSMIGLIITGALFLTKAMAYLGLPAAVAGLAADLALGPLGLILALLIFYVILGTFLDGLSVVVMTLPMAFPLVMAAGYDPVWFGIFLVIAVEMAQITPPVGFNLFVVQDLTGEPIGAIARSALPFFLIMAAFVLLMALWPEVVHILAPGR
ncbi:MAG: TRAP transporter large permease subunit [Sphingomonadales bacterium]